MTITTTNTCEACGGLFRVRLSLADKIKHCSLPGCREARQRQRDRDVVRAWEELNRHIPEREGFYIPHLEDERGRWRPWYKLKHMRDLAKEYRIYERMAALRDKRPKEGPAR